MTNKILCTVQGLKLADSFTAYITEWRALKEIYQQKKYNVNLYILQWKYRMLIDKK